ncbi:MULTISPECIES: PH domain-containing protein [Bacillaceae]|uniref:PH domain-containing protein n=1 Tax=Evansella alkalicola TaxID=745819 RepID=A0ABS6JXK0_9BACI|nr:MULTISPECIES: PH domain-containing protein [Bacillaceae]MBU9723323.1 PH domain-containing protein [Bacillus alkalicola]
MDTEKRYHPVIILIDFLSFIKGMLFPIVFLFLLNRGSDSVLLMVGKYAFWILLVLSIPYILLKWFTYTYRVDTNAFHVSKGIFVKSKRSIPFYKIENMNRKTGVIHRLFRVTSLRFETGITGEESTVEFKAVSLEEAAEMERLVESEREVDGFDFSRTVIGGEEKEQQDQDHTLGKNKERHIHYTPTKRDTVKAAFTSLSFLIIFPVVMTIYSNTNDILQLEERTKGLLGFFTGSVLLSVLGIVVLLMLSIGMGMIFTFIKYGKYEISSDDDRIYIKKGVMSETTFTIVKERVQAIEMKQTLLKRILGLAEVKLISAGEISLGTEDAEVNSLYPFLPVKRAYQIVSEILPEYEVLEKMDKLPRVSLLIRLVKPYWVWAIATGILYFVQPTIFGLEIAWWLLSLSLFLYIVFLRLLNFYHTRYTLHGSFVQFQSGSLTTSLFVSRREKIVEVSVSRRILQKKFGLASIGTMNRGNPIHMNGVEDVPVGMAKQFYSWYYNRRKNET